MHYSMFGEHMIRTLQGEAQSLTNDGIQTLLPLDTWQWRRHGSAG